jgi:hypothetical protein
MAHMQSCSTGIREHVEHISLGLSAVVTGLVCTGGDPIRLPFLLYISEIVFHAMPVTERKFYFLYKVEETLKAITLKNFKAFQSLEGYQKYG